jgi:hypothetical protein
MEGVVGETDSELAPLLVGIMVARFFLVYTINRNEGNITNDPKIYPNAIK